MAFHCSGSDRSQWQHLADRFSTCYRVMRPNLSGPEVVTAGWSMTTLSLAEEAKPFIEELRQKGAPAHLVGHSYGGAVALHIAQRHPELVASLCVYEPTLFSLLRSSTEADAALFQEIRVLAHAIQVAVDEGCAEFAAQAFTDFWGGLGAWQALRRDRREKVANWVPKCPLDFGALLFEPTVPFRCLDMPVTLIVGSHTHKQTKRIAEILASLIPHAMMVTLDGAGHLGPFTLRDKVENLVEGHLEFADQA